MTLGSEGSWKGLRYTEWYGMDRMKHVPKDEAMKPNFYRKWRYHRVNPNRDYWNPPYTSMDGKLVNVSVLRYSFPQVYNSCNNAIVRALSSEVSSQQYLADLYEAKSAVDLVNLQLKRILKATRALKKLPRTLLTFKGVSSRVSFKPRKKRGGGPRRNTMKMPDVSAVPSAWLEWNFAVKPIVGSLTELANTFDQRFAPLYVRGMIPDSNVVLESQWYFQWESKVRVNYRYFIEIINPNVGIIDQMGLRNNFSTVWEIMPWSWAIDYFVNVGELMSNLDDTFKNARFTNESCTWRFDVSWRRRDLIYPSNGEEIGQGITIERFPGLPKVFLLEFQFKMGIQQTSYLASAIALTLKGKMS